MTTVRITITVPDQAVRTPMEMTNELLKTLTGCIDLAIESGMEMQRGTIEQTGVKSKLHYFINPPFAGKDEEPCES